MEKDAKHIESELARVISANRVKTRLIDRVAYASDAGFYKLTPKAIVMPESVEEVRHLFSFSQQNHIPITFRTGGTSLSGQAITDGILVDLSQFWRKIKPENDGKQVRVQPGVIGAIVNAHLKKYKSKIGPDPSSIGSAMMGGILSNNSSGMCCGVDYNSYHTLKYISFLLPDGTFFDTENNEDYARFEQHPIAKGIEGLRDKILADNDLINKIRSKYKIKNTVGYSLNAFVDYSHPIDIFAHLLIGAEGTLAFITEAVLNTIPDYLYKSTALLYFGKITSACDAIIPIKNSGANAIELMDRASLRSIESIKGIPVDLKSLPEDAAALLIEYQSNDALELQNQIRQLKALNLQTLNEVVFTEDVAEQALLWKVRKGMFPSVGAVRAQGTTVILEDIAFPVERMAEAIADLQALFKKYEYFNAIIFGHAKDGNIHFVITQTFNEAKEVSRYDKFMNEVIDLVVKKYDGSLKAEHGTGRNMAPFVETEWGVDAYEIMRNLKTLVDPYNLLNPGVIINPDRKAHIKNLKKLPVVEQEVDKCIECGACEPKCPSKDITLSPRRRIVVRREMQTLLAANDYKKLKALIKDYKYDGLQTCAVDGMCATDCPVDINTGDLVKRLRRENHSSLANATALMVAKNFKAAEYLTVKALQSGTLANTVLGRDAMLNITKSVRKIAPTFPLWNKNITPPAKSPQQPVGNHEEGFIYFSTCISRIMGGSAAGKKPLQQAFFDVAKKANINLVIPKDLSGTCCGQAFSSKGYQSAFEYSANRSIEKLWQWTHQGKMAVVMDLSSCTQSLLGSRKYLSAENQTRFDKLKILDTVDFLYDHVLPMLTFKVLNRKSKIALHPVCSLIKLGTHEKFKKIAEACAHEVIVPVHAGCCGMAGDRGFLFPELTASATREEAIEMQDHNCEGHYSSAKTCEMALSEAVGKNYESIVYLLDEALT